MRSRPRPAHQTGESARRTTREGSRDLEERFSVVVATHTRGRWFRFDRSAAQSRSPPRRPERHRGGWWFVQAEASRTSSFAPTGSASGRKRSSARQESSSVRSCGMSPLRSREVRDAGSECDRRAGRIGLIAWWWQSTRAATQPAGPTAVAKPMAGWKQLSCEMQSSALRTTRRRMQPRASPRAGCWMHQMKLPGSAGRIIGLRLSDGAGAGT